MKKMINRRMYDTEIAKEVGHYENGLWGSFDCVEETLYKKRNGEFFLYGEGGARTSWAVSTGENSWKGGEGIRPLTEAEAREWIEEHMDTE